MFDVFYVNILGRASKGRDRLAVGSGRGSSEEDGFAVSTARTDGWK